MVKRLVVTGFVFFCLLWPRVIQAEQSGLTIPGSIPTLAPLSAPLNSLTFPHVTALPASPTASPGIKSGGGTGFSVSKIINPYLGKAGKATADFISGLKLDGVTKIILMQLLEKALAFLKSYNDQIDPMIRKYLTVLAARLPESIRGFVSIFIPFMTMVGKVILGVIAAVIALKIIGFLLSRLFSSLFHKKRRRK